MKFSSRRLQRQLILSAFLMTLGLVFFSFILVYQSVKKELSRRLGEELASSRILFERFLDERYKYLLAQGQVIANDPRFFASVADGDRPTAEEEARRFQRIVKSDFFTVCDTAGRLLASVASPEKENFEETDPLLIKSLYRGHPRAVLHTAGGLYQIVRIPLTTATEGPIGELILGYSIDSALAQTLKDMTHSEVVFFLGKKALASTLPSPATEELAKNLANSSNPQPAGEISLGGETFFVLPAGLDTSPGGERIYCALLKSRDAALNPIKNRAYQSFLVLILLGFFSAFLGSVFLWVKVGSRLEKLVSGAYQISSGNLDFTLPPAPDDEIGRLSLAFNQMRISLKNRLEELKEAHAKSIREQRLGIVGRMASSIIHDFRGPMQIIQGAAEILTFPELPEEKRAGHSQIICQQVERMANMTQELLDFAKGETRLNRAVLTIEEVLTELNFQAEEFCRNSPVKFDSILQKSFQIWADKEKILRVLVNLVRNAKEAMPEGGAIKVTAFLDGMEGVIQVSDNGSGIAAEIRDRLFEPFATFGKPGGTGLGLALSKKIIDDHGGSIYCESEPGKGTAFTVRLPAGQRVVLETPPYADTDKVTV